MSTQAGSIDLWLIVLAGAVATYLTRIGGYVMITRLKRIPPRLEAALNAVPAAVLTTLVAPAFVYGGWDVTVAMAVSLLLAFRVTSLQMLFAGWLVAVAIRHLIF